MPSHPFVRAAVSIGVAALPVIAGHVARAQTVSQSSPTPSAAPSVSSSVAPGPIKSGTISGVVTDAQQHPAPGTIVVITGPTAGRVVTDADGAFSISNLQPGLYRIDVTKAGFTPAEQSDIAVTASSTTTARIQLAAAQFSSIRQIGRVSVSSNNRNAISTSTAAVATISGDAAIAQGQLTLTRVLDQVPGLSIGIGSGFAGDAIANGASPLVTGVPSLRGSLPYETASLIDGHPISIGVFGTFNPAILSPYVLQDVEIVKGPGASAPNINYAIGGTQNFRTLEPTRQSHVAVDTGIDQFGGQSLNLRTTGSLDNGKVGYAFDYAATGTQGPDRGYAPEETRSISVRARS